MELSRMAVDAFVRELSSDAPAPGGGSVAALAGSLSAGLCAMVARLTVGREKYKDAWAEMETVRDKADHLAARLLELVDEDTAAYNQVTAAFRLPKGTDEEKSTRSAAIQEATKVAAQTPLETLRAAASLPPLVKSAIEQGNPNCVTDAGVAAQLIRTAANGAAYNVRINLGSIKDEKFRDNLASETDGLLTKVLAEVEALEQVVESRLG